MELLDIKTPIRPVVSLVLAVVLLTGLVAHGYAAGWQPGSVSLRDLDLAGVVGGLNAGACGIVVGLGLGILAIGASTVTMGLGGALLISVTAHVATYACLN